MFHSTTPVGTVAESPTPEVAAAASDAAAVAAAAPPPLPSQHQFTPLVTQLRKTKSYKEWVTAIESESSGEHSADFPLGLRRCRVCATRLATPLHMEVHLQGRRHAEGVAARYFQSPAASVAGDTLPPSAKAAAAVLAEHSTALLAVDAPEPPDAAMMALRHAFTAAEETDLSNGTKL